MLVIIMRGVPGIGKSSLAKRLRNGARAEGQTAEIVSADDFFLVPDDNGGLEYRFDPSKIGEAHARCMVRFLDCLMLKRDVVIVDNTNTRLWEFEHYQSAAKLAGYEVEFMELHATTVADIKRCASRNTHGVPEMVIAQMALQYERLPE